MNIPHGDKPVNRPGRGRRRALTWLAVVLAALALHLLILVSVRPGFFEIFRRSVDVSPGASSPSPSFPRAIVVVPVETESDQAQVTADEPHPQPRRSAQTSGHGDADAETLDILDVVGQAQAPIPSEPSAPSDVVPPRPVEITWPRTRGLGHCLGLGIAIRIRVGADGQVMRVEPVDHSYPADCTQAAVDAAQRIHFEAGTVNGHPEPMWTTIRIDFQKRR